MKRKFLAIIPVRGGSKRIPNKNIKMFNGKPLLSYTIKQAKDCGFFDRVIVDTDNLKIARTARKYGAEVPFLRPRKLAGDNVKITDVLIHLLSRLGREQDYFPDFIAILQVTSPLRELEDIQACYKIMLNPGVKSVATVCDTSPWLFNFSPKGGLILANKKAAGNTNTHLTPKGYYLNGAVFMVSTDEFIKFGKSVYFYDGRTIGIICPKWRSIDLDDYEDWILAEYLYRNKKAIANAISKVSKG